MVVRRIIELPIVEVVNIHWQDCDILIQRPSEFGNPYKIDRHIDRDTAVRLFRSYLEKDPHLLRRLRDRIIAVGKPVVRLGCSCKPAACHGDIYVEMLR